MATFKENLEKIRSSVYGRDVRQAMGEGLEQCNTKMGEGLEQCNTKIDGKADDAHTHDDYAKKTDTMITGTFSQNRREGTDVGAYSHAEGSETAATNSYSHSEGRLTTASGNNSHAEGFGTTASGSGSHAEGERSRASGSYSHAEGYESVASGNTSHAEGEQTIAKGDSQHVQGKFNVEDTENKYAHIVGNGVSTSERSNAHTLDWDGNGWFAGKLSQEGTPTEDKDLVTKKYLDGLGSKILWRGGLLSGGTVEFNVPEECWHNNHTQLTLVIESFLKIFSSRSAYGTVPMFVTLSIGDHNDFGISGQVISGDEDKYRPYNSDGYTVSTLYRYINDTWITSSWTPQSITLSIKAKKVADSRYAICTVSSDAYNSSSDVVITNISAYIPKELQ